MGKRGIIPVIGITGCILLAVPVVLSQFEVEVDVISYSGIVGICIILIAAVHQASSLAFRHQSSNGKAKCSTELSLNEPTSSADDKQ